MLVSIMLVTSACATARSRADDAFNRADYVFAAEQYGKLVESSPTDASLLARRDEARARALVTLATRVGKLRAARRAEPALAAFAELMSRRRAWADVNDAAAARLIAEEVAAASAHLHGEIGRLAADQPLAAEEAIAARRDKLGFRELDALWSSLATEARSGGQTICRAAAPASADESPYLARLTSRYCAHFGTQAPLPALLPEIVGGIAIAGAVSGMTDEQRARLEVAVESALRSTPWFAEEGPARARVALGGHQAVAYGSAQVARTAPWSETVRYTERESYQEPYQESYQESYQEPYQESYTVQVPHTEYHTESYSCGYGSTQSTCTRTVSSTSYRSETQYRTAFRTAHRTAYRTAYRTAWRDVSKTREEPRTFEFAAIEETGNYSGTWSFAVALGASSGPLDVVVADSHREVGYDHDVTFPAANVWPTRAQLPSFDGWFARLLAQLTTVLPARLTEHWGTSFCQMPSFGAETAARCAYGAVLPGPGRAELARLFGNDVDRVIARFAPSTAPR